MYSFSSSEKTNRNSCRPAHAAAVGRLRNEATGGVLALLLVCVRVGMQEQEQQQQRRRQRRRRQQWQRQHMRQQHMQHQRGAEARKRSSGSNGELLNLQPSGRG